MIGTGRGPAAPDDPAVRAARRRFARRQWARRWLAWRRLAVGGAALALVAVVAWLLYFSSVLAVAGVTVRGVHVLSPARVRTTAAVPLGDPVATVDLGAVAARVRSLAPVRAVDVSRAWPDRILVSVTERTAVAVVERGGVWHALDRDGVLFRSYHAPPADLPRIRTHDHVGAGALAEAATVVSSLPGDLAARVSYVEVRTVDDISLRLHDGRTVLWGSADRSRTKADVVAALLHRKASTYDVSVPGQPTTRR